jgi:hypothetical protein
MSVTELCREGKHGRCGRSQGLIGCVCDCKCHYVSKPNIGAALAAFTIQLHSEYGMCEEAWNEAYKFLKSIDAVSLIKSVDATDGGFYIKDEKDA